MLATGADARNARSRLVELGLQFLLGGVDVLAPQVAGVVQLGHAIANHQADGVRRLAGDDDAIVTRVAQLRAKAAAGIRLTPAAGGGRQGNDHVAAASRSGCADQGAGHENEGSLWAERLRRRVGHVPQVAGREAATAYIVANIGLVDSLVAHDATAQVHTEQLTQIAVHSRPP